MCQKLSVQPGGTTADGKITLEFAECIGVCEGAPAVLVNDEGRPNVTPDKVDALIEELRTRPPKLHHTLATMPPQRGIMGAGANVLSTRRPGGPSRAAGRLLQFREGGHQIRRRGENPSQGSRVSLDTIVEEFQQGDGAARRSPRDYPC